MLRLRFGQLDGQHAFGPHTITLYEKGPRRQSGYMGRAGARSRSSGLMAGSSSAHLSMAFSE
jgi:hypothetical protein